MSLAETKNDVVYVGKDLEAMAFAANYHRWILADIGRFWGNIL